MKRLRGLLPGSIPSFRSEGTTAAKAQGTKSSDTTVESQKVVPDQPCGPSCWLKGFLTYPGAPDDVVLPFPGDEPATDGYRREITAKLYKPVHAYQTRIIKLLPGAIDDPVSCELLTADLIVLPGLGIPFTGDIVQYDCLSYSWGYPVFSHRVSCNGLQVPVIASLYEALRHLRLEREHRYLWIDAFCINQFDDVEKSRQVQNMLLIYQKCTTVRAWLGMPEGHDRAAARFLNKIHLKDWPIVNDDGKFHDEDCARRYAVVCADLNEFFSKSWWSRTWIRQEVFAGRKLIFHLGPDVYGDDAFGRAIEEWQSLAPKSHKGSTLVVHHAPNLDCWESMRQSRIPIKNWMKASIKMDAPVRRLVDTGAWLEGLLASFRFGCSDARDKVYGVVGMLEERSRMLDREAPHSESPQRDGPQYSFLSWVDYSKSRSEIYQELVKWLINRDRNLLSLCIFRDRVSTEEEDPSWVLQLDRGVRSWFVATHLTAGVDRSHGSTDKASMDHLLHSFATGSYGDAAPVGSLADGRLKCSGYRLGVILSTDLDERHVPELDGIKMRKTLTTSPPLPNKAGFHHFLSDYGELMREAKYHVATIKWSMSAVAIETYVAAGWDNWPKYPADFVHRALDSSEAFAMVSQAACPGDEIVLLNGSPLPLVVRCEPESHCPGTVKFLGPASMLWKIERLPASLMHNDYAPGYLETAGMFLYARKYLQEEDFELT